MLTGSSEAECQRQVDIFNATCKELGIELNAKSQPPRQLQRLLGSLIDIRNQRITLAPERLLQIRELATCCLANKTCPRAWCGDWPASSPGPAWTCRSLVRHAEQVAPRAQFVHRGRLVCAVNH